jgi:hypothetical protein
MIDNKTAHAASEYVCDPSKEMLDRAMEYDGTGIIPPIWTSRESQ